MKLDVNKQYSGFVIRQAAYIDEIHSEAYVMEHTYSGARLLYLGNNDDNKVFRSASGRHRMMIQVWRIF